jgi:hypothetical protein
VLTGVKEFGAESEIVSLTTLKVQPCTGNSSGNTGGKREARELESESFMGIPSISRYSVVVIQLFLMMLTAAQAAAWNDRTHMAVVEAAGAAKHSYLAVGAEMAKERASIERLNHYCNNPKGTLVTSKMILGQVPYFSIAEPESGHLYGA